MANTSNQRWRKHLAAGLTAIFMGTAVAEPVSAHMATTPDNLAANHNGSNVCVQTIHPGSLENLTGYTEYSDFRTASAYASFLSQIGGNPVVLHAILNASEETGVDFDLMVVKAILESSLGKYDKPIHVNGAARGLYQFMPDTWLTLFAWFGDRYNNGQYKGLADAIRFDGNGNAYVNDRQIESQILALRSDHHMAAFIKAMHIKYEERPVLKRMLGREPELVDYYMVHFLGIPRAKTFYKHLKSNPDNPAAPVMKREARNNHFVFYNGNKVRSFEQVYKRLERIIENRLDEVHTISDDVLANESCTPPLHKDRMPNYPAPPPSPVTAPRFYIT